MLLAGAAPAAAHATLVSTDPTDGSLVARAPAAVSATFDEAVGVAPDSLRVFAPDGTQVDTGATTVTSDPDTVRVELKSGLGEGTYTVAWHVVSADTHPVQGAFTFSVGHRSGHVEGVGAVGSDRILSTVDAVDRGLGFAGFVVVAGGLVFVGWCWPSGWAARRTRRLLAAGWVMTVLAAVVQLPVQGLLATERGVGGLTHADVWSTPFQGRVGIALVIRMVTLWFIALLTLVLRFVPEEVDVATRRGLAGLFAAAAAFAAVTWSGTGHATVGSRWPLALAADVVHLVAAATWLGGLVLLVLVVLPGERLAPATSALVVRRFSPVAAWCVLLIAVTGTYQAWRNTRSWAALVETRYGLLVCAKIVLLALLVLLALQARRVLGSWPFRASPDSDAERQRLRRGVALEAAVAAVVLGVTAVLVQSPTARESYHPVPTVSRPFDTGGERGVVTATLRPARIGPDRVVLRLVDSSGAPYRPRQLTANIELASAGVGPLPLTLHPTGPGSYQSAPVSLGFQGTWSLSVVVRSSAFDESTTTLELRVT